LAALVIQRWSGSWSRDHHDGVDRRGWTLAPSPESNRDKTAGNTVDLLRVPSSPSWGHCEHSASLGVTSPFHIWLVRFTTLHSIALPGQDGLSSMHLRSPYPAGLNVFDLCIPSRPAPRLRPDDADMWLSSSTAYAKWQMRSMFLRGTRQRGEWVKHSCVRVFNFHLCHEGNPGGLLGLTTLLEIATGQHAGRCCSFQELPQPPCSTSRQKCITGSSTRLRGRQGGWVGFPWSYGTNSKYDLSCHLIYEWVQHGDTEVRNAAKKGTG
jgi:hypothetical protein